MYPSNMEDWRRDIIRELRRKVRDQESPAFYDIMNRYVTEPPLAVCARCSKSCKQVKALHLRFKCYEYKK